MHPLLSESLSAFPSILLIDFLRYGLAAMGVYLITHFAMPWLPLRRGIRNTPRPGFAQMRREFLVSLRTVGLYALIGIGVLLGARAGVFRVYMQIDQFGWLWLGLSVVLAILIQDAWFYWVHRILHRPALFRRFHIEHHRSHNPTAFAAYRFDWVEALAHGLIVPLLLLILPMHPMAIFLFATHSILRNVIGHNGIEVFPARADGRPLFDWITTVTHHDLHHEQAHWNMGLYFTWWDRWGGTEHPDYHAAYARAVRRSDALQQAPHRA